MTYIVAGRVDREVIHSRIRELCERLSQRLSDAHRSEAAVIVRVVRASAPGRTRASMYLTLSVAERVHSIPGKARIQTLENETSVRRLRAVTRLRRGGQPRCNRDSTELGTMSG